ncbi:hypothetical protein [Streptomyces sp. NPDC058206]|uniref:hypothetical protein n=1 Tax=Streptomyces sp. NPDC058206 TaxID=3346382 RepID=UPI0036EAD827
MNTVDLLRSLGVNPSTLDPAPSSPWRNAGAERLRGRHPCVRCGGPAQAAGLVDVPGYGRRWLDRCMPCLIATTPRGDGPRAPLADTLAVLRETAREAGVDLTIVTGEA